MYKSVLRKITTVILTLSITLTLSLPSFAATDPVSPAVPSITAKAAIAYCSDTNETIYAKNINKKYDPLSMTKIMTAYIVMKRGINLNKTIKINKETASTPWMNYNHLRKGEKIKVKYLLYFALLPSENDAATALGQAVAGSNKAFVKIMNKEAKALGCKNSNFTNAHGCITSKHKTTVSDMVKIAQAAFQYSYLRKISETKSYTIPKTNKYGKRHIYLTNLLIASSSYKDYNVIAGKTGSWDSGNTSLVEMSSQGGKTVYTVVMKDTSSQRYPDMKKLIKYSKDVIDAENAAANSNNNGTGTGDGTGSGTGAGTITTP